MPPLTQCYSTRLCHVPNQLKIGKNPLVYGKIEYIHITSQNAFNIVTEQMTTLTENEAVFCHVGFVFLIYAKKQNQFC